MTLRILHLLLWGAVGLVVLGLLIGVASVAQAGWNGNAAQTTLPLRIEPARTSEVVDRVAGNPVGQLILDRATLEVHAGGPEYAVLQGLDIIVTCGLWLLMLLLALKLVRKLAQGSPFDSDSVVSLRTIGASMIALNCWAWLRLLALPPILLAEINPSSGGYRILPSIAQSVAGVRNARIDVSLGIGLLAAGLLVLALAEAFRIGVSLREDSEGIV